LEAVLVDRQHPVDRLGKARLSERWLIDSAPGLGAFPHMAHRRPDGPASGSLLFEVQLNKKHNHFR
jgi:hypothetical protein